MIVAKTEKLVRLADVPKLPWLPQRQGRPLSYETVRNWATHGLRGVRLEKLNVGGSVHTSEEALQRFFERLTDPAADQRPKLTAAQAKKSYDRAVAVCEAAGI